MFFKYKEGRIRFFDTGKGITVVLLHGYLESAEIWNGFREQLSKNFRVIAIDLPGHGESDVFGETHTMEFMAEAVIALIDSLNAGKAFIIGHSMGGYVTLAMADMYAEKLSGYCLFHSQPFPDPPVSIEKRQREISMVREGKKNLLYPQNIEMMFADTNLEIFRDEVNRSKQIASRTPAEGIIAVQNGMIQRTSRKSVMETGKIPCLWILGALDNYIPLNVVKDKLNLPVNARIIVLERSGHMGFIEEQQESLRMVTEFIRGL